MRSVTLSCALCSVITICILSFHAHLPRLQILKLLGWYPIDVAGTAKPLLLTALLFAGPLFEKGVVEGKWKEWVRGRRLYECLDSWIGWRNYIAVRKISTLTRMPQRPPPASEANLCHLTITRAPSPKSSSSAPSYSRWPSSASPTHQPANND